MPVRGADVKGKAETAVSCEGRERLFAISVTALFLLYAGVTAFHHEMWRDEMQAWLICRDTPSPLEIFHAIRYEGHPVLWFLLVWPLTRLTRNPEVMKWLNLLIAASAVFLIVRFAPAQRWVRASFAFGYYAVYEYGSIARNYAIGVLMLVAFCALFPHRRERPLLVGVLLFLAANTSVHACILTIAALVMLVAENITRPPEALRRLVTWAGVGIALGGIVLAALQMHPPPDSGSWVEWHLTPNPAPLLRVFKNMTAAYLPLPKPGLRFWQSSLLAQFPLYANFSWVGAPVILMLVSLALVRRPLALVYYLTGSLGLLVFFYAKHPGYLRHHGFLFVCFGMVLWLAATMEPVRLPQPLDTVASLSERLLRVIVPLLLTVQVAGAAIAATGEYRLVFSGAKAAAEMMKARGLDRLPLVAEEDKITVAVMGYLDKDRAYYPTGGRFGSYVVWDSARYNHYDVWDQAIRLSRQVGSPVVVILDARSLNKWPPPPWLGTELLPMGAFSGQIEGEENFFVFLLGGAPATR